MFKGQLYKAKMQKTLKEYGFCGRAFESRHLHQRLKIIVEKLRYILIKESLNPALQLQTLKTFAFSHLL